MAEVAIVSYARWSAPRDDQRNEIEMLLPVLEEALDAVGLTAQDVGFVCSGSSDYVAGQTFAFVGALDAVGPWPPIAESHLEMDAAFALYETWLLLQQGEIDTALVYGFGKSSPGDLPRVLALQTDPYQVAPLFPDAVSLAGLQARALLDKGQVTQVQAAESVVRAHAARNGGQHAAEARPLTVEQVLEAPRWADPLRKLDCAAIADGCAAVVLATGDRARELSDHPVWIRGMDHRIESSALGARDLTDSPSTRAAAVGAGADADVDLAELHAPFSYQEVLLSQVLGLDAMRTRINPSGGALACNPVMVAGLDRIGQAAARLAAGEGRRALAHATSGPCLQQNLIAVLEADHLEGVH